MVHFTGKFMKEMKEVRATDKNVEALLKLICLDNNGEIRTEIDVDAFRVIWYRLQEEYGDIKLKLEQLQQIIPNDIKSTNDTGKIQTNSRPKFSDEFIEEIKKIYDVLQDIDLVFKKWSDTYQTSSTDETKMSGYMFDLVSNTNKIYRNNLKYMKLLGYNETLFGKIRKVLAPIQTIFLTLGLALGVHTTTMESGLSPIQKQENLKSFMDHYNKTHVNIPELGMIQVPDGYELYAVKDSALVTNYTPTGKGLSAGKKADGTDYKESGKTSTGLDALNDFTGVATDSIRAPPGSIVYIDSVGWKIADDTGGAIRKNSKKGITQFDVRTNNYQEAINWGTKYKNAYIFVRTGDDSNYVKVREARKMYRQGIHNFFKRI